MRKPRRPALDDIAAICGLSRATVARALSGTGYVEETRRKAIQKTADALGYRASTLARALRTQRSRSIGVLIPDITNPVFPRVVKGLDESFSAADYTMFLCNTDEDPHKQVALTQSLIDRHVDGLVLVSQSLDNRAMRDLLRDGPPAVFVNRRSGDPAHDYVGPDNRRAIDLLVRHLADLGHQRIGFISGPAGSSSARDRLAQFPLAMAACGRRAELDLHYAGDYSAETGRRATRHFFRGQAERPTAIIASNDLCALGVIDEATGMGLRVPGDLSVTGFDDIVGFDAVTNNPVFALGLTTIDQPKRELGAIAAQMLLQRLSGNKPKSGGNIEMDVELRIRDSTAPPHTRARTPSQS
jgi:LacI family transcriptional regulator